MYPRDLQLPAQASFLLGPRGTGKSTWLREHLPQAKVINLLPPATTLEYEKDPALLRREVETLPTRSWVVVDEIQRVPKLLDEVHFLMENRGTAASCSPVLPALRAPERKISKSKDALVAGLGSRTPVSPPLRASSQPAARVLTLRHG